MPIILPAGLPAADTLRREGVTVFHPASGHPGCEPLRVLLVNLMPDKPRTELQFARMIGASHNLVELTLTVPEHHEWQHTDAGHLRRFYVPWREARWRLFDALIVTGAPVEMLAFEDVDYWDDMRDILDWAERRSLRSMFVCWAAQAALYHRHGVQKHALGRKCSGVYRHSLYGGSGLLGGLNGAMTMPVSRHTEIRCEDLPAAAGLRVMAVSPDSGLGLVEDPEYHSAYLFNHPEYDATALADEYVRDIVADRAPSLPENYFPDGDPNRRPVAVWRDEAHRLYGNWLEQAASDCAARDHSARAAAARRSPGLSLTAAAAVALFRHVQRPAFN